MLKKKNQQTKYLLWWESQNISIDLITYLTINAFNSLLKHTSMHYSNWKHKNPSDFNTRNLFCNISLNNYRKKKPKPYMFSSISQVLRPWSCKALLTRTSLYKILTKQLAYRRWNGPAILTETLQIMQHSLYKVFCFG